MKVEIKNAVQSEVYQLTPRLRADDKAEIEAAGYEPLEGLLYSFKNSHICKSVYVGETIIGMFGACYGTSNWARVWFLGSDECENYPLAFIKEGKKFIKSLLKEYNLFNQIYKNNKTHIEYVKRLGFTVQENDSDFYEFFKLREE